MTFPILWHLIIYFGNLLPFLCHLSEWTNDSYYVLDFTNKVAWNAHCVCKAILMVGDVSSFVPNFSPLCCWLMFAFMVDTIMENGRHLAIFKNAADLFNMFVVLTRMAYSSTVYFEFIIPFSP